ncbi:uncharacterized protein [Argopecten irradians]|uniref:uncharacterized protein n=1 Tax=Argopecten irradians TaxID=31199 RepID=UPI0037177B7C
MNYDPNVEQRPNDPISIESVENHEYISQIGPETPQTGIGLIQPGPNNTEGSENLLLRVIPPTQNFFSDDYLDELMNYDPNTVQRHKGPTNMGSTENHEDGIQKGREPSRIGNSAQTGSGSPEPGPSHAEGSENLPYTFQKVKQRTFKNSVVDTHYEVKFNVDKTIENKKLSTLYGEIEGMFDDVIGEASQTLQESDLGRIIIHHDNLSNPIYVPLRPLRDLTGEYVMEHLQNVLNSHQDMPMDQSFRLDCPSWYYIKASRQGNNKQKLLADALCLKAGVPNDRFLTVCDIPAFEDLLNVDILVVAARMGNKFLKIPSKDSKRQRMYLYLVGTQEDGHFHAIVKICGFFGSAKFCEHCLIPCRNNHYCENMCNVCHRQGCTVQRSQVSCIRCHRTCRSIECFNRHKELRERKHDRDHKSDCELYWSCTNCKRVLETRKRKPEEHRCGEWLCNCCKEYVNNDHLCYVRALEPKSPTTKYVFFDFECGQEDNILQCHDKYASQRNPKCPACKGKIVPCNECAKCINCQKSWCGKYRHTPNLVIAHTACELCKDKTIDFKCEECESRCEEDSSCTGREVLFEGNNAASDFGKWLFDEKHKGFLVFAHKMKGYDGYF